MGLFEVDFYKAYHGLTHPEGMRVIKLFDDASLSWENNAGILGEQLCKIYEGFWTKEGDVSRRADELILAAQEVLEESR